MRPAGFSDPAQDLVRWIHKVQQLPGVKMVRARFLKGLAFVTAISFVAPPAITEVPSQTDIDSCNHEAAAAAGASDSPGGATAAPMINDSAGASPEARPQELDKTARPDQRTEKRGGDDDSRSPAPGVKGAPEGPASQVAREAFAACLAKHGYYKGYYR